MWWMLRITVIIGCLLFIAGCSTPHQKLDLNLGAAGTNPKSAKNLQRLITGANVKIEAVQDTDYQPLENDIDGDGLTNEEEIEIGTDPHWPDTDNDRLPDGYEFRRGNDPLQVDEEAIDLFQQKVSKAQGHDDIGLACLQANPLSCTMVGFNATTCTATCTGTCIFGSVSCYWSWDPIQWAIDKAVGGPCPGWMCHCP